MTQGTELSSKLSIEFERIKKDITEAYIAVGMITEQKYDFFMRGINHAKTISVITGIHMPTAPEVLVKLKHKAYLNEITAGVFADKYFHPKLYLFKLTNGWIAFVGSGNFTNGGWHENEELFVKITDTKACQGLKEVHEKWFAQSLPITEKLLSLYTQTYSSNVHKQNETRKNIGRLVDSLKNVFNIDNVDFTWQFFSKDNHLAFQPGKTHLDTPEIWEERTEVRNRLYDLNDLLVTQIPAIWNVHPHYDPAHIASNIETKFHHDYNVRGLWVGYGRNKPALKKYGETDTTPLFFMRMQVIIQYDLVGVWLMPGKAAAGQIDREYFKSQMETNANYSNQFYELLTALGENYWIEVADENRKVTSFTNPDDLKAFVLNDNWRYYYFIIGRDYQLGSAELRGNALVQTVLTDFKKYQPLYEMIRDNSMDHR